MPGLYSPCPHRVRRREWLALTCARIHGVEPRQLTSRMCIVSSWPSIKLDFDSGGVSSLVKSQNIFSNLTVQGFTSRYQEDICIIQLISVSPAGIQGIPIPCAETIIVIMVRVVSLLLLKIKATDANSPRQLWVPWTNYLRLRERRRNTNMNSRIAD